MKQYKSLFCLFFVSFLHFTDMSHGIGYEKMREQIISLSPSFQQAHYLFSSLTYHILSYPTLSCPILSYPTLAPYHSQFSSVFASSLYISHFPPRPRILSLFHFTIAFFFSFPHFPPRPRILSLFHFSISFFHLFLSFLN